FFQAEDGIRDDLVTGVQTCALPISHLGQPGRRRPQRAKDRHMTAPHYPLASLVGTPEEQRAAALAAEAELTQLGLPTMSAEDAEIGRASCREQVKNSGAQAQFTETT